MKLMVALLMAAVFLLPQTNSYADGIDLQLLGVSKGVYGKYNLGSMSNANTAAGLLAYSTSIGPLAGFCVEDVWGTYSKQTYYLNPIADGTPHEKAAYFASQYFAGAFDHLSGNKNNLAAAVQLSIWKTVLGLGEAVGNPALNTLSSLILKFEMPGAFDQSGWFVAVNEKYQDYLVYSPVYEPATMLLLGLGLIGLAGYGRRRFKN